ncbi:unnamed protein product [Orchesella dallaii]|uniref:Uncharacterized protein n=1 Tax=Orchesella dallaii TaxID=48710 RepID=A0ABP1PPU8_9HEXA
MPDYSPGRPLPYVAPPPPKGAYEKTVAFIGLVHRNYNMITSLYMMEPMERAIINCIMILIVTIMLYSSWVYLPHYTYKLLVFTGVLDAPEGSQFLDDDAESLFLGKPEL